MSTYGMMNGNIYNDMKYIRPTTELNEAQAAMMIAESLPISDKTVDGSQALTKEDNGWDIWDEE